MRNRRNTLTQSGVKTTRQAGTRSAGFVFVLFFLNNKNANKERQRVVSVLIYVVVFTSKSIINSTTKASDTSTPTHGLASTLRMRTAISSGQWTAVSALLAKTAVHGCYPAPGDMAAPMRKVLAQTLGWLVLKCVTCFYCCSSYN